MEPFVRRQGNKPDEPGVLELAGWMAGTPGLAAGFTTRLGGVSQGCFDSLNCALHVRDAEEDVIANRRRVAEVAGIPFENWVCGEQVHGNRVHAVTEEDRGRGWFGRASAIQDADALVTDAEGVMLASFYADCVPLIFLDPVKRVVAVAHAGWKGTVTRIGPETVHIMQKRYHSSIEDIRAAIGPSIGPCCYEVDNRVLEQVRAVQDEEEGEAERPVIRSSRPGHAWLDLRELNRQLLKQAGILPTNIECTNLCTGCDTGMFFSHRKEGGATGRMMSFIGWKKG
ncbi:peptidoglycan editing factor PgeF [Paenibacillus thiaminolyticus]|uniref:peptidoglycan editing factor PgeF n=1 Tax=Paenibacillus thiaminolyticus TaxID=49283 RepID=UPI002543880D|nr:peptidoglycan editing factor PgeF [Paenibacillus thiaminolyticus]WII39354.1 peptidoglycan editing factor PgeF [Paenibacillus thiaminolyticus]